MTIDKKFEEGKLSVVLEGRLDTNTAPQLEAALEYDGVETLEFDFKELVYVSSAGLRVLLAARKAINASKGTMVIRNVNDTIMEVFEITGFADILTIE